MHHIGLRVAALALAILSAASAQTEWTSSTIAPRGVDLNAVYFSDSRHGWVGGTGGFIARTTDGGATWTPGLTRAKEPVADIHFTSNDTGFLVAGPFVLTSEDGGRAWRTARVFLATEFAGATPELYGIDFVDRKRGWVVGSVSRDNRVISALVASTSDGGATWKMRTGPAGRELVDLVFIDERRGWLAGSDGAILHTADGGDTWSAQTTGTTRFLRHIEFLSERVGWAVGDGGTILHTADGGQAWIASSSPVSSALQDVRFASANDGWIIGREGQILRSADRGQTWSQHGPIASERLGALFVGERGRWIVGGNGLLLRSRQ